MMGAFAEFERNLIKERQREGIAQAVKNGKNRKGTPPCRRSDRGYQKQRLANGAVKVDLAKEYGISRPQHCMQH